MTTKREYCRALQPPTPRQLEVYEFLFDYVRRNGFQPSMREIQEHFEFASPNAVFQHLRFLQLKGWLTLSMDESRATRFICCPDGRPFQGFREV